MPPSDKSRDKQEIFLTQLTEGHSVLASMHRSGMDWREVQEGVRNSPQFALLCLKTQDDVALDRILRLSSLADEAISVLEEAVRNGDRPVAAELVKRAFAESPPRRDAPADALALTPMADRAGRLLLIEDEAPIRALVTRYFRRKGFEVDEASSAEEVLLGGSLARAYAERPVHDCLLLDVHLPGLSGIQVARMVGESWPHTPIIFITGDAEEQTAAKILRTNNSGYLLKPFDLGELEALVRKAMARGEDQERLGS